jgi:heptosyltransferase-1
MTGILVVRLGAMGDIIHTLPAAATLRRSFPGAHLTWLVESRWSELLEGNPYVDHVEILERGSLATLWRSARRLRGRRYDLAVDFQGLLKSAISASIARPEKLYGFHPSLLREKQASWFYSRSVEVRRGHVVDMNLELASATGASNPAPLFPIPEGRLEAPLPPGPFVLANPLAGWAAKQWPLERYTALASRLRAELNLTLVLNSPPNAAGQLNQVQGAHVHVSGLQGLIHATRRAEAVVGLDSGPMHLAAALGIPGVALFGPTDPARNGPYGESFTVLRSPWAATSYKRRAEPDESMWAITPEDVVASLKKRLAGSKV